MSYICETKKNLVKNSYYNYNIGTDVEIEINRRRENGKK